MLATTPLAFNAPDLSGLIQQAFHGVNTGPATIHRMLSALETQLRNGPLQDLNSGTLGSTDVSTEVSSLVTSFQNNVDQQLSPRFPNIDSILKQEGAAIGAEFNALDAQSTAGLISNSTLSNLAGAAVGSLTNGPLSPLNTPNSGFVQATTTFEDNLNAVAAALSTTAKTPITLINAQTVIDADAQAYSAAIAAATVTNPQLNILVDNAVTDLQNIVGGITAGNSKTPQAQLTQAITTFDQAVLGDAGVFGANGPNRRR